MKQLIRLAVGALLVASFVVGFTATTIEAKPVPGCYELCNKTTYQISVCCPFIQKGEIVVRCHNTGDWCYPE